MGFYALESKTAPGEINSPADTSCLSQSHPPAKNRVWEFFADSGNCVGENGDFAQYLRRENHATATNPAPDVPKGNISEYIDLADGSIDAHLEYDAFGRTIASTGNAPAPFGFSTKYLDEESGYYYYGFRYYDPETGRWLNRDPIWENGGTNLYAFVLNNGFIYYDLIGLSRGESSEYIRWEWYDKKPNFVGQVRFSNVLTEEGIPPNNGSHSHYRGSGPEAKYAFYAFYMGGRAPFMTGGRRTGSTNDTVDISFSGLKRSFRNHVNREDIMKHTIFMSIRIDIQEIYIERGRQLGNFGFHGGRVNVLTRAHALSDLRLPLQRFRMSYEYWCKFKCKKPEVNSIIDCRIHFEITDLYDFKANSSNKFVRAIEKLPEWAFGPWGTPYWIYGKWRGSASGTLGDGFDRIDFR